MEICFEPAVNKYEIFLCQGSRPEKLNNKSEIFETFPRSGLCDIPEDNHLWAGLRVSSRPGVAAQPDSCWLGHGWGQCRGSLGQLHYQGGLSTCYWWHASLPSSLLRQIVREDSPVYRSVSLAKSEEWNVIHDRHFASNVGSINYESLSSLSQVGNRLRTAI